MSFNKKFLSVLLIALVFLVALTGCKKTTPAEEAAAEVEAAVEEAVEEAAAAEAEAEEAAAEVEAAVEEAAAEAEAEAEETAAEVEAAVEEAAAAEAEAEEAAAEVGAAVEEVAAEAEAEAEETAAEVEAAVEEAAAEAEAEAEETAAEVGAAVEEAADEAEAEAEETAAEVEEAVEEAVDEAEAEAEETAAEVEAAVEEAAAEAEAEAEETAAEVEAAVDEAVDEAEAEAEETAAEEAPIASVDGVAITSDQVKELAVFNRYQYISQYQQYAQMYQMYGLPLDTLNEQMESTLSEAGKEAFAEEVIDQLVYDKILESEAEKIGIELDDAAIVAKLKEMFGYEDPVSDGSENPLGLQSYDFDVSDLDDDTDRNAEFKAYVEYVSSMGYDGALTYDFLYNYAKHILLEDALFAKAIEDRVFEAEMVNANHILVETEEQAQEIIKQLNDGADWKELAAANSLDTSNKDNSGALGWFSRGQMVQEFEDAAFALEPGEISEPIHTNYGYHIIQSLGKENRELTGDALTAAQDEAYSEWATEIRRRHEIETHPENALADMPTEPVFEPIIVEEATDEAAVEEVVEEAEAEAVAEDLAAEAEVEAVAEEVEAEDAVEEVVEEAEAEAVAEDLAAEAEVEAVAEEVEAEAAVEEVVEEAEAEAVAEDLAAEAAADAVAVEAIAEEIAPAAAEYSDDDVVAEVNGKQITVGEFKQDAIFSRYQYLNAYDQYAMIYSMYGLPLDELNAQAEEVLGEENKEAFGETVINDLIYNKILEIEAESLNIEISDEELDAGMKDMSGYAAYVAEAGSDSADLVDFDSYIEAMLADYFNGDISKDVLTRFVKTALLEEKLFDHELEGRTFEAEMVNARHILVEDEATAKEILEKLNAGEDWNALASEYSLDTTNKDNGGALDWFPRGMMVQEFEDAAFALEPGKISEPVKTTFGYHIIAVDGKEVRPLTDDALAAAQSEVYTEWTESLLNKYKHAVSEDILKAVVPGTPVFVPAEAEIEALSIDNTEEDNDLTIDNTEEDETAYELSSAVENE